MDEIIDINTIFGPLPAAASDLSVDELRAMMQRHGVRRACTLSTVGVLLDHNAGNGASRAACADSDSLFPAATINPQALFSPDAVPRLAADGFKLLRLFPATQRWEADYAPCLDLLKQVEPTGVPVMLEVERPGSASRLVRALGAYGGAIILSGIDQGTLAEAVSLLRGNRYLYVETSSLLASGAIKQLADSVGSERVLFGSSAPAHPMASCLRVIQYSGLADAQRAQILGGNAAALLKLQ